MKRLLITSADGLYYADSSGRGSEAAANLEQLLLKLDPGAPPEKVASWAEMTEALLGPSVSSEVIEGVVDDRS